MPRFVTLTPRQKVSCLIAAAMPKEVGTPAMAEVDRELMPIIAELTTLGPGNDQHPSARELFNWLVDPKRTAEEFIYAIGPVTQHVCCVMVDHFYHCVSYDTETRTNSVYLCKVSAEALAARCPFLEGPWETVAWHVVALNSSYPSEEYGFASNFFSAWIISVIGDPNLCPNSYLRFHLITLVRRLVDNQHNQSQAIMSVMYVCSNLDIGHLWGDMNLHGIAHMFEYFGDHLFNFDKQLADRLNNELNLRSSAILQDVAYNHSMNSAIYTELRELRALVALLKITRAYILQKYKYFLENGLCEVRHRFVCESLSHTVYVLFSSFRMSFQKPQLVDLAASCIMDFVEFVLLVSTAMVAHHGTLLYTEALVNTDLLLEKLLGFDYSCSMVITPVLTKLIHRYYHGRLSNLIEKLHPSIIVDFPSLYEFFYEVPNYVGVVHDFDETFG
ncbi:unnamed protein product [Meganyctiphanes norvegica]|uniref:Uncharacterized protein n=1 Tax=Meganyctiphanes norvegica TaxID=48144 RepID=A0AAV2RLS0_MEGNR